MTREEMLAIAGRYDGVMADALRAACGCPRTEHGTTIDGDALDEYRERLRDTYESYSGQRRQ